MSPTVVKYKFDVDEAFTPLQRTPVKMKVEHSEWIDKRGQVARFKDKLSAIWEDFKAIIFLIIEEIKKIFTKPAPPIVLKGHVIVLLHGLGSRGTMWAKYKAELESKYEGQNVTIFVPENDKRGNQPLNRTVDKIWEKLGPYCKSHPDAKIALVGSSLGGRVALELDAKLNEECADTSVLTCSIAAALFSQYLTKLENDVPCIAKAFVNKELRDHLRNGNTHTGNLIARLKQANEGKRARHCFAASEDDKMTQGQALPATDSAKHWMVYGSGHIGLAGLVREKAVELIESFIPTNE